MNASLLHDLFNSYRLLQRRRTTRRTLSTLDDHMLRDIGLERSDIEVLVNDMSGTKPQRGETPATVTPLTEGTLPHLSGWILPRQV